MQPTAAFGLKDLDIAGSSEEWSRFSLGFIYHILWAQVSFGWVGPFLGILGHFGVKQGFCMFFFVG